MAEVFLLQKASNECAWRRIERKKSFSCTKLHQFKTRTGEQAQRGDFNDIKFISSSKQKGQILREALRNSSILNQRVNGSVKMKKKQENALQAEFHAAIKTIEEQLRCRDSNQYGLSKQQIFSVNKVNRYKQQVFELVRIAGAFINKLCIQRSGLVSLVENLKFQLEQKENMSNELLNIIQESKQILQGKSAKLQFQLVQLKNKKTSEEQKRLNYFNHCGLGNQKEIERLAKIIDCKNIEITMLKRRLQQQKGEVKRLSRKIRSFQKQIADFQNYFNEKKYENQVDTLTLNSQIIFEISNDSLQNQ